MGGFWRSTAGRAIAGVGANQILSIVTVVGAGMLRHDTEESPSASLATMSVIWTLNERLLSKDVIRNSLLTEADMRTMRWIRANTGPVAVFQNQYGDAGPWIPAITFRGSTDPHLNPFYFDESRIASPYLEPKDVCIGKKKALGPAIPFDEFESEPDKYQEVYDHDGVIIYQIISYDVKGTSHVATVVARPNGPEIFGRTTRSLSGSDMTPTEVV
jgi:hypothetical protein